MQSNVAVGLRRLGAKVVTRLGVKIKLVCITVGPILNKTDTFEAYSAEIGEELHSKATYEGRLVGMLAHAEKHQEIVASLAPRHPRGVAIDDDNIKLVKFLKSVIQMTGGSYILALGVEVGDVGGIVEVV